MSYESITFKDKNPVKRYLQRKRLADAARIASQAGMKGCVLDYGAGNGELCKLIASKAEALFCFEPVDSLMREAQVNLASINGVSYIQNVSEVPDGSVDCVFCLEVFEHLPESETQYALSQIHRILKVNGLAVIGVPIEIHLPALYKGAFRMCRRYGAFDARIKHILQAALGFPPKSRPVRMIAPDLPYHSAHMGFDYRDLLAKIRGNFHILKIVTSPHRLLGRYFGAELNILITKS